MNPFYDYLSQKIECDLKAKRVVVVYDKRLEFAPFVKEIKRLDHDEVGLEKIRIGSTEAWLSIYEGSYYAIRNSIEGIVAQDTPEPLLVYLPGEEPSSQSVLMEIEKAGDCKPWSLKRSARYALLKQGFTDGQVDEMLRPESVTYQDVVSFVSQENEGQPASILRNIFDGAQSESLITQWIAGSEKDSEILRKDAQDEFYQLIESRLGFTVSEGISLEQSRNKVARFVLIGEFRSDLAGESPSNLSMIPEVSSKDAKDRVRSIAQKLRSTFPAQYSSLAFKIEEELSLADLVVSPDHLGKIDTFPFEEKALLQYAAELIALKDYEKALSIVSDRKRSFWVDRDLGRQAQWEACGLMADLGVKMVSVANQLRTANSDPAEWVQAYSHEDGWHLLDSCHRGLETWVANMEEEPVADKAIAVVRREFEELLKQMASGFSEAFEKSSWSIPKFLHQTQIYPELVQKAKGKTAYILVDALRYEMGAELAKQLDGVEELTIKPAITALPSITPVGMAALLPQASMSFSVVPNKGKVAAEIEGTRLGGFADRFKFLSSKRPDAKEITLGKLLGMTSKKVSNIVADSSLLIVRSQEIDFVGEMDGDLLARQVMDTIINNLSRAVKKLVNAGVETFIITADHGHQFSVRKDDDMKIDNPGGDILEIHRRCWMGHGGTTPPGTVRLHGADLGYSSDLDFVFPKGLGVFKSGGGLSFHHGGFSLQELVIPVVSLRAKKVDHPKSNKGQKVELRGVPAAITNRTLGIRVFMQPSLLTSSIEIKLVLVSKGEIVGKAGMAIDADLDRSKNVLTLPPGVESSVGLMLTNDDCGSARIMILDAKTDAVLQQSDELQVKLGI